MVWGHDGESRHLRSICRVVGSSNNPDRRGTFGKGCTQHGPDRLIGASAVAMMTNKSNWKPYKVGEKIALFGHLISLENRPVQPLELMV